MPRTGLNEADTALRRKMAESTITSQLIRPEDKAMHGITLILFAVLSWPFTLHAATPNPKTMVFEIALKPESELHKTLTTAFRELLQKQGYEFQTTSLPPKRGLQELKSGRVDGSIGRIGNLAKLLQSDQLIRLDIPVAVFTISRWCRRDLVKTAPSISVATRLGTLVLMMLKEHMDQDRVRLQEIGEQKGIVQMIKSARLDCLLSSETLLEADGIPFAELKEFDRFDLVTFEVYPWLQKRHEALKPILDSQLKSYSFPDDFRKKYLQRKPACDGKLNALCPDGLIIKSKADLS
jgi:hypothetical protein